MLNPIVGYTGHARMVAAGNVFGRNFNRCKARAEKLIKRNENVGKYKIIEKLRSRSMEPKSSKNGLLDRENDNFGNGWVEMTNNEI